MKKLLSAVLLFSAIGSVSAAADAQAAGAKETLFGRMNEKEVLLHRGATADYRVTHKFKFNDEVLVLGSIRNNQGEEWLRVRSNDDTGWIQEDQLRPYGAEGLHLSAVKDAAVRRGAEDSYTQTDTVQKNKGADVYASIINSKGERWVKANNWALLSEIWEPVLFDGWVNLEDLTILTSPEERLSVSTVTAAKSTPVFSDSQLKKASGDVLTYKYPVSIAGVFTDAISNPDNPQVRYKIKYQVKSRQHEGWVDRRYIDTYKYQGLYGKMREVQVLNAEVRRGAGENYKVTAKLKKGTIVTIHDTYFDPFQKDGFGTWRMIKFPNGQSGWVNDTVFTGV